MLRAEFVLPPLTKHTSDITVRRKGKFFFQADSDLAGWQRGHSTGISHPNIHLYISSFVHVFYLLLNLLLCLRFRRLTPPIDVLSRGYIC